MAYRTALREGRVRRDAIPRCLYDLHLVVDDEDAPGFCVPVPPEGARFAVVGPIEDQMAEQRRKLRAVQARLASFESVYSQEQDAAQPLTVRLTGKAAINAALEVAVGGCRKELLTAQPGGGRSESALHDALGRDLRALGRGVRQRTIYQHTVYTHRPTMAYIEQVTAAGAEVRTLAEILERVIVCDREVAFIPLSEDASAGALQIRDPAVVRFVVRFFDQVWERSVPVRAEDPAQRSPVVTTDLRQSILRAVVAGETDSAIARRLGMSRRSVAEHIRKVSDHLGSGSRAQLGYLLATSGLLDRDE
ncbi:LuxR C-terminal-related transcriptional regulator [Streptomyces sp. R21]|uniref:LuxR C-terminal-related transcriptional regulator n=1 Tax=Streptomyces sp. R21 TaxID=3238627 RepID=A0AB39P0L3_9ACTN